MTKIFTKKYVVITLALFCCFLWGSAFPCIKIGYKALAIGSKDTASQILFAGIRFTIAGIMVILFEGLHQKKFIYPKKSEILPVIIISFFQTIIQYVLFYMGLSKCSGVSASVIEGTNVFIALIFSCVVFRQEKMKLYKWAGCLIGFAGVIAINITKTGIFKNFSLSGEGLVFLSTFGYAISSVLIKNYSKTINTVMISGYQFLFGGVVMSLGGLITGGNFAITDNKTVLLILYMAFISAAAYSVWSVLLKYNPISFISVIGLSNPVFGVILSALLLGEYKQAFSIKSLIALILISIGIIIVNRKAENQTNDITI